MGARKRVVDSLRAAASALSLAELRKRVATVAAMPHPKAAQMSSIDRARANNTPIAVSQKRIEDYDDRPAVVFRITYHVLRSEQKEALAKAVDELGLEVIEYDMVGSRWDWKTVLQLGEKGRFFVGRDTVRLNPLKGSAMSGLGDNRIKLEVDGNRCTLKTLILDNASEGGSPLSDEDVERMRQMKVGDEIQIGDGGAAGMSDVKRVG